MEWQKGGAKSAPTCRTATDWKTKSWTYKTVIAFYEAVAAFFCPEYEEEQDSMRRMAGDAWTNSNLVFTNPLGDFLPARTVYNRFKRVVEEIGAPSTRFHDGCIKIGLNQKHPTARGALI